MTATRLVVGISGATGTVLGVRLLELARKAGVETHLVVSPAGQQTRAYETDLSAADLAGLADVSYRPADVGAAIASGAFDTIGMIILPCSVRTVAAVATGTGDTLLARAADVTLKERRRLVVGVREAPLSLIHLRNLVTLTEAGAIVLPPVPAFYLRPSGVDDIVTQLAARALDLVGVDTEDLMRWHGPSRENGRGS
ncbi:MAG TPA: UbiX family flavin prenyltransferase [Pseudonocardiaceae bacterium]